MRAARQAIVLAALAATPQLLDAQREPAGSPHQATAIVNANVVDVRGGRILPNTTVVVREAKIATVGPGAAPAGLTVIDARGRYVVPGLIDAHTHIANLRAARPRSSRASRRRGAPACRRSSMWVCANS